MQTVSDVIREWSLMYPAVREYWTFHSVEQIVEDVLLYFTQRVNIVARPDDHRAEAILEVTKVKRLFEEMGPGARRSYL